MIKAIIFDCYGVLVTDSWLPFKHEKFSSNPELLERAGYLNWQCDMGHITFAEFIQELSKLSGEEPSNVAKIISNNSTNKPLFDYIRELKKTYRIGVLSNAGSNILDKLFSKEEKDLFDATALSYETGFTKPDPKAFQVILDKLRLSAEECILVDDQERYCAGAEDMGLKAVCYSNFEQFKSELQSLL